jgi:hypothetical protein
MINDHCSWLFLMQQQQKATIFAASNFKIQLQNRIAT